MPLKKAAGKDGIPIEFYIIHTDIHNPNIDKVCLLNFLLRMYNESYDCNNLTPSQSQNIVTLIFKKHLKTDRRLPKNYRPITLQNLDYKILYHTLSKRLVAVIDKIIPFYQHAFVPKRCISDAILLFKALIKHCANSNMHGAILSLDFEKAYDSVDHQFTLRVLKTFKIPDWFVKWVNMAFKSSSMQLIINGYLTNSFPMLGGGKQGDPLYPYIFLMVMTTMAAQIQLDPNITGIKHPNIEHPISTIQFADDSPFMIGCESDFTHITHHLSLFEIASGMVINKDKTIIVLLGNWNENTPQFIIDSPFKKQSINTPFVVLGTVVGPKDADNLNWQLVIEKVRMRANKLNSPTLTLNGKILVANACITSLAIYPATHTYIPYKELETLRPILNQFTTPTSKYISYNEKIKPQQNGGPLVTLLDPLTLCPTQNAKWVSHLTSNLNPNKSQPSWTQPWIHTLFAYVKSTFKILFIDHILFCDFNITMIKTNVWYDPMIINALKWYKLMKFTRTPNFTLYEDCSTLPIWYNPLVRDTLGFTFNTSKSDSPFKHINPRKLYFVGQLFTNWAPPNWNSHSFVQCGMTIVNGTLKSNHVLNAEFSPNRPISDNDWQVLKLAVQNSPLYTACMSPITPFMPHEFLSTLVNENGIPSVGDVYELKPSGKIRFWERDNNNIFLLKQTNQENFPNTNDYPSLNSLYRIHTHTKNNNQYVIGLIYKIMKSNDKLLPWNNECFHGILQNEYTSSLHGANFKEISKTFRHTYKTSSTNSIKPHTISPFFQNLSNTHPFIKWKTKMKVINNTRVKSECKTVFWRVLTNNLYLGECAYDHLTYDNGQCHPARHKYEFCPYCSHNVHSIT